MRVIAAHVGGGFGCKIFLYPEYCLVAALARKTERPIKWMETRSENFVATTHGRDHLTEIEVGANKDGTLTSLKVTYNDTANSISFDVGNQSPYPFTTKGFSTPF